MLQPKLKFMYIITKGKGWGGDQWETPQILGVSKKIVMGSS